MEKEKLSIPLMLAKLDEMFIKENNLKKEIKRLCLELEQTTEDIELMEQMIMHKSNRNNRLQEAN